MKKLFIMAVVALSLGFTACTSNTEKSNEADALVESLKTELESGDADAIQGTLEAAQEKIAQLVAENPEEAKTYVAKIQDFLKENNEKISEVIGDNLIVQGLVSTITNAPAEAVIDLLTAGQSVVDNTQETIENSTATIQEAAENKVNDAINEANQKIEEGKEKVNEEVNKAAEKVNEKINEGADKLLKGAGLK